MSEIRTTDDVCAALSEEARSRAEGMAQAGQPERSRLYSQITFEARGLSEFSAASNDGDMLDLVDMVLEAVEERHGLAFITHRDGGGVQTLHWSYA
jgi:hypothetical protein